MLDVPPLHHHQKHQLISCHLLSVSFDDKIPINMINKHLYQHVIRFHKVKLIYSNTGYIQKHKIVFALKLKADQDRYS